MDSQCVLYWIQSCKPLPVFVENRLREIKAERNISFRYVPTLENPADLATKGKSANELFESLWWHGPSWLKKPIEVWPTCETDIMDPESLQR